jgi:large subunit ribosomal protein L19
VPGTLWKSKCYLTRRRPNRSEGAIYTVRLPKNIALLTFPFTQVLIRGVCLALVNRGLDSSFLLKDVYLGEIIERRISLYAPLIQEIKVLQRAHIHKGKKRVRRSKLYYLRDRDPLICRVS